MSKNLRRGLIVLISSLFALPFAFAQESYFTHIGGAGIINSIVRLLATPINVPSILANRGGSQPLILLLLMVVLMTLIFWVIVKNKLPLFKDEPKASKVFSLILALLVVFSTNFINSILGIIRDFTGLVLFLVFIAGLAFIIGFTYVWAIRGFGAGAKQIGRGIKDWGVGKEESAQGREAAARAREQLRAVREAERPERIQERREWRDERREEARIKELEKKIEGMEGMYENILKHEIDQLLAQINSSDSAKNNLKREIQSEAPRKNVIDHCINFLKESNQHLEKNAHDAINKLKTIHEQLTGLVGTVNQLAKNFADEVLRVGKEIETAKEKLSKLEDPELKKEVNTFLEFAELQRATVIKEYQELKVFEEHIPTGSEIEKLFSEALRIIKEMNKVTDQLPSIIYEKGDRKGALSLVDEYAKLENQFLKVIGGEMKYCIMTVESALSHSSKLLEKIDSLHSRAYQLNVGEEIEIKKAAHRARQAQA